jgi:hypothetical protein
MAERRTARDRLDRIFSIMARAGRFWLPSVVVVVVGTACSLAFAFTRHRVYKSETLMLYRETIRSSDLGGPEAGADPARKLGMKLKEMILSRTRLQQIIDEFHLFPSVVAERGYVDATDELRAQISFRVKDGDTFGLSYEGEDPERVQQITARLAEALIAENTRHRAEQAEVTKSFLDAERKRIEDDLREKETALARFLTKHPEFAKEGQAGGSGLHASEKKGRRRAQVERPHPARARARGGAHPGAPRCAGGEEGQGLARHRSQAARRQERGGERRAPGAA